MINEYGMETLFGIIISYYSLARRARLLGCAVELSFVSVPGWLLILAYRIVPYLIYLTGTCSKTAFHSCM